MFPEYDVIVVGAGHAGCEAAAAAANLGSTVLLITMNMQTIAQMSCNPAMGGIAKGQIVREIDAMGGYSGIVSDRSMIQFRMLNRSKGPAMWSPRTQNDRMLFATTWREMLEQTQQVDFYQDMVSSLIVKGNRVCGVVTGLGHSISAKAVVVTSGTFLNGVIHIGEKRFGGGRVAEKAATGITEQLVNLGFESDRLKTGTPPRIDGRSLDYTKMEEQKGDDRHCWLFLSGYPKTPATEKLLDHLHQRHRPRNPSNGIRPQSHVHRPDRRGRPPILPEHRRQDQPLCRKRQTSTLYRTRRLEYRSKSMSMASPPPSRKKCNMPALTQVPGFENVRIFRPGYAIEYDYFPPTQLSHSLETKSSEQPLLRRPDQRHHRVRRSRLPGTHGGHQRPSKNQRALAPSSSKEAKPISACSSTTSSAKARKNHIACSPPGPNSAPSFARTTPTSALRNSATGWGSHRRKECNEQWTKTTASTAKRSLLQQFSLEPDETANYFLEKETAPLTQKQKRRSGTPPAEYRSSLHAQCHSASWSLASTPIDFRNA